MASINPQIDAAVVLMKARAAEFDDEKIPMDEWVKSVGIGLCVRDLLRRADNNLWHFRQDDGAREDLIDTMNLCALALSLLSEGDAE